MCTIRKKCPSSEFFYPVFSRILTEYKNLQSKSPHSIRMLGNTEIREFIIFDEKIQTKITLKP